MRLLFVQRVQTRRPRTRAWLACAFCIAAFAGCGDDSGSSDGTGGAGTGGSGGVDAGADATADVTQDVSSDVAPDVAPDATPDVTPDVADDVEVVVIPPDECDIIVQNCPDGQKCTFTVEGNVEAARCLDVLGDDAIGETCERPTAVMGEDTCAAGGLCVYWGLPYADPYERACVPLCRTDGDCSADKYCSGIRDAERVGACVLRCDPFDDTCPTGTKCSSLSGFDQEVRFTCLFEGQAGIDEPCSGTDNIFCQEGLHCTSSGAAAACYPACDDAHPCDGGVGCSVWNNTVPDYPGFGICRFGDQAPGEPCTWGELHPDAGTCEAGLACLGNSGWASCATDADCVNPAVLNPTCVNNECGHSYCGSWGCTDSTDCEATLGAGSCCRDTGNGVDFVCIPAAICGTQGAGDPCAAAFGGVVVNPNAGLCGDGLSCFGAYDSADTCTTDQDCGGPGVNGCFDGGCGKSFCTTTGCSVAADCSAYGTDSCCSPVNSGAEMACSPAEVCPAIGSQGLGEPCTVDVVNPTSGDCALDLWCAGSHLDGDPALSAVPCTVTADCGGGPEGWDCFDGYCGMSLCTRPCAADADCSAWGAGACCRGTPGWCMGATQCTTGTQGAGELCDRPVVGITGAGDCTAALECVGYHASSESAQPIGCTTDPECVTALGTGAICHNGACSLSWCSQGCSADADCEADYGVGSCCAGASGACYPPGVCSALGL